MISQDDYLTYLKGIATKIDASGIAERYRPVALQLMAKPFYYAKNEGVEQAQKNEEKVILLFHDEKMGHQNPSMKSINFRYWLKSFWTSGYISTGM